MNKILTAAVTTKKAQQQMVTDHAQIDRETLFNYEENNYYIKDKGKYVLLGGKGKQNLLVAGDNIEILEDGIASTKVVEGTNGSVRVVDMTEGSITIEYKPEHEQIGEYPYIYLSAGWDRLAREDENPGLVAAHTRMIKDGDSYYFTTKSDSFKMGNYVYIGILTNDGTGEKMIPQGNLANSGTWGYIQFGVTDKNVVRLKDDVVVRTLTLSPGTEEDPIIDWKGTIKLGSLEGGNTVYLITKATEVSGEEQSLFGGQLLIRMETEDGREVYAQYSVTITSTGSWSLWGGSNAGSNARVCKAKYQGEWYYGLKIPTGEFQNVRTIDVPSYGTQVNKTIDTYVEVDTEGDLHLGFATRGATAVKLELDEHLGVLDATHTHVSRDVYSVRVKDFLDNELGLADSAWSDLAQPSLAKSNLWQTWYQADEKIKFILQNQRYQETAYNVTEIQKDIYLYKASYVNNNSANFNLAQGNNSVSLTDDGQAIMNKEDPDETSLSSYNHWYSCSVYAFRSNLLAATFNGEWATYASYANRNRYRLCFRIYNRDVGTDHSVRITRIQIRDLNRTNTGVNASQGGVEGAIVVDFKVTYPDAPFHWLNTDLINLTVGDADAGIYPTYATMTANSFQLIGRFLDRVVNTEYGRWAIKLAIEDIIWPSTPDFDPLTEFDELWATVNQTRVNGFTTNKIPLKKAWSDTGTAILYYGGDNCWSYFGAWNAQYQPVTGITTSYEYFTDKLDIKRADLWYNGWYDIPDNLIPPQPPTGALEFQVLARESQDADSYSEVINIPAGSPISNVTAKIDSLQPLGEDAPPYYISLEGEITIADLQNLSEHIKEGDRQIYLDLGKCTMARGSEEWKTPIFINCISLRGIKLPKGITAITTVPFMWCTYLRELDLTPSAGTLTTLGGGTWGTSCGVLTSTRVIDLIIPRSVNRFNSYIVYSSNIKNLILLHNSGDPMIHVMWDTWLGNSPIGNNDHTLPEGFHIFCESGFENTLRASNDNERSFWTTEVKNSITTFKANWSQAEWQNFENTYHWGEELINRVRREFGATGDIEILNYKA